MHQEYMKNLEVSIFASQIPSNVPVSVTQIKTLYMYGNILFLGLLHFGPFIEMCNFTSQLCAFKIQDSTFCQVKTAILY